MRLEKIIQYSYCKHDLSDKPERVLKLLLEVNNSETLYLKYKNPEEYLTQLITATNCLVSSYGGRSLYPPYSLPPFSLNPTDSPRRYRRILFRIQRTLLITACYKAQDLLNSVFQLGRERSDFTEEEKREIGTLMIAAFIPIKTCMICTNCFSRCKLSTLLQRRSALQFLLEDYATFPAGNIDFLADFYEDKINASTKRTENLIKVWCDYLGEGEVDEKEVGDRVLDSDMSRWYEKENDLKEAGASEVPESHTWWADSIKKCITEASRSCKASKEKLLKSLTDIQVYTGANRVCGIVLKAKKIVEPTMSTTSLKCSYGIINMKTNALIFQLKSLIVGEEPGCNIAEKIVRQLEKNILYSYYKQDLADKPERVLKLLLEVNNSETLYPKYKNPEEYLTNLITATNCLVSTYGGPYSYSRYPTDSPGRYRENLFRIQRALLKSASYNAGDLLCSISVLGRARSDFSEKEKKEIGTLMAKALQPIKTCIKGISCFSRCKLSTLLQRRSALQFLLDDYATFPVGNTAFLADFYEDKMIVSIKSIDNVIRVSCDYLGEGEVDEKEVGDRVLDNDMSRWYEKETDLKEAGAPKMPESHTWWADSIKKCITEVSRSCKPLKDQLVKRLKDIRVDPIAIRFCGLISKAKKITELSKDTSSPRYYGDIKMRADIITYNVRNLIAGDKPEYNLAKKLVAELKDTITSTKTISDKSKCVLQLLLEIDNSESLNLKYRNSEEYLKHLITKFADQKKLYYTQYDLAEFASDKCKELLTIIFQISRARSDFSEEQKREIGTLMIGALQPIETYMKGISCFSGYKLSSLLQHRSALQFLLDDYATFPVGIGALLQDFYEDKINVSIRSIDNIIRVWCDYLGEGKADKKQLGDNMVDNDMDEWLKDEIGFEEAGAYEVPESHTWWADSIKKCIHDSYSFDNVPDFRTSLAGTKDNEIFNE